VYDGKVWHAALAAALALMVVVLGVALALAQHSSGGSVEVKKVSSKKSR
jgi:hypothetical protein